MIATWYLLAVLVVVILLTVIKCKASLESLSSIPTLPIRWPIFGNALEMDMSKFHLVLAKYAKTLGGIYRIKLFSEEIVVLSSYEAIHEALVVRSKDFAGRPLMYRTSHAQRACNSIVWQTYTSKLIFLRKHVFRSLKMFGMGLERLERNCQPEIRKLLQTFKETQGLPFQPWDSIFSCVCNIMLVLLIGKTLPWNDPDFQLLKRISQLFNETFGSGSGKLLDVVPWMFPFTNQRYKKLELALKLRDDFWNAHAKNLKMSDCDVLNSVVGSLYKVSQGEDGETYNITEDTIKEVFTNTLLAGTDTTATALVCLLLILVNYPDIQQNVHQEIDASLGPSVQPCLLDRVSLPYLEAVLLELLRYISHVPLAVPHCAVSDTKILQYRIPSNTTVYINLWALHHDDQLWVDPWVFDPTRFLDETGRLLPPNHERRKKLMAFGAGRRVCVGEILGKNRLFLFAASLLQQNQFVAASDECLPEVDPQGYFLGLVLHPKPFKIRAIPRL